MIVSGADLTLKDWGNSGLANAPGKEAFGNLVKLEG